MGDRETVSRAPSNIMEAFAYYTRDMTQIKLLLGAILFYMVEDDDDELKNLMGKAVGLLDELDRKVTVGIVTMEPKGGNNNEGMVTQ